MKNRKAWIWLTLAALMLSLVGCGAQPDAGQTPAYRTPQVLSTVSVRDGAPGQTLYASTEKFSLYIDETAATFSVTDPAGNCCTLVTGTEKALLFDDKNVLQQVKEIYLSV